MRDAVKVPDQLPGEGEEQYAERLRQVSSVCMCLCVYRLPVLLFLLCYSSSKRNFLWKKEQQQRIFKPQKSVGLYS